jgi:hypothetical protein
VFNKPTLNGPSVNITSEVQKIDEGGFEPGVGWSDVTKPYAYLMIMGKMLLGYTIFRGDVENS